jgi:NifB/MoaA-like Fe-S oxidoreductase
MAPILDELADDLRHSAGVEIDVKAVKNSLFGGEVSVAGLMPGADVVRSLAGGGYSRIVLPRAMFDTEGSQTIDGWSTGRIAEALVTEVVVASGPAELISATLAPPAVDNANHTDQGAALCAAS